MSDFLLPSSLLESLRGSSLLIIHVLSAPANCIFAKANKRDSSTSINPGDLPIIDPGYLSNPLDLEVIARHLLGVKNLAQSPQLGKLLEQPLKFRDPAARLPGILRYCKKVYLGEFDLHMALCGDLFYAASQERRSSGF